MHPAQVRYHSAESAFLKAFTNDTLPLEDKRVVCRYALLNLNFAHANLQHAIRKPQRVLRVIEGGVSCSNY